ncbi:phage tail tube protein [Kutzneria chonburiensis]|uniref:Fibronectin type-III domain-containing protein n=1 Tax=Kutzneria chonburiensis TaxID=1483604 RepID=A0ABV6N4X1_9PSEU|nr:hypothetical protein [Kutzneria chonburiensis]
MEPSAVRMGVVGQVYVTAEPLSALESAQLLDVSLPVPDPLIALGYLSDDGFEHEWSEDVKEIVTWSRGTVSTIIRGRSLKMTFTALESNRDVVGLFYGSDFTGNVQAGSMRITNGYTRRPGYTVVYDVFDDDGTVWRLIVPSARVGALTPPKFNPGSVSAWGISFTAVDTAGYLATWTTNDPSVTDGLDRVSPPLILFPEPDAATGLVRPDGTIGGLGMRGGRVLVTTSAGLQDTCVVSPTDGTWWAQDITALPTGGPITVTAVQQLGDDTSAPATQTFTVYPLPERASVTNISQSGPTLTVQWSATPSPLIEQWVFWMWKVSDGSDTEKSMFTTTGLGAVQFDIDQTVYPHGTVLAVQIEAAGPGVSQDSTEVWFATTSYNPPHVLGVPTMTGRTITVDWSAVDDAYPESGYQVYATTDNRAQLLGSTQPEVFTWSGPLPDMFPPGSSYDVFVRAPTASDLSPVDSPRVKVTAPAV